MKTKIILSALLFITTLTQINANNSNLNSETETQYWKFIKERLFDGENQYASKFQNSIYINLQSDCKEDSLIVSNLIEELRTLIPNKILDFAVLPRKTNPNWGVEEIFISVNRKTLSSNGFIKRSKDINGNQIFYDGFKGVFQSDIYAQHVMVFLNDTVSQSQRKRYIEYAIIRSLATVKGSHQETGVFFPGSIFNDFEYSPHNTNFSKVDKFLLQKLYSEDFKDQFKTYLTENYSRRYYRDFLFEESYRSIKSLISIILIILTLGFSYKTILFRNYKHQILNYIVIGILIGTTASLIRLILYFVASKYVNLWSTNLIEAGSLILLSVVFSIILYIVEKYLINSKASFNKKIFLKIVSLFLLICIPLIIIKLTMSMYFDSPRIINLLTFGLVLAIGRGFLLYLKELGDSTIRKKDFELIKLKELNTDAEMQSLNAKINPHFLYNSLNSIVGLVRTNPDKTEKMAIALSDLYKYSTNRSGEQTTSIQKEVEMVLAYLEIEKIRFGERLKYSIQVDSDVQETLIPRNIIQPLVENAIKHGISYVEDEGHIELSIKKTQEKIEIIICDNGPDFPEGLASGFGLKSIQDIIKLYYKGKAQLSWQNEPSKMVVIEINTRL